MTSLLLSLQYTVIAIANNTPMNRACLLGCGITTGYGATVITSGKSGIEPGSNVAVLGAGCVGPSIIQGAVKNKATKIIVVGLKDAKAWAKKFGATDFVNPMKLLQEQSTQEKLIEMTDGEAGVRRELRLQIRLSMAMLERKR